MIAFINYGSILEKMSMKRFTAEPECESKALSSIQLSPETALWTANSCVSKQRTYRPSLNKVDLCKAMPIHSVTAAPLDIMRN